ncbi:MAG: hypothetical protein K0S47_1955 [Herbinix sp.]|jgi:hypothetical protein|nr:hypothetical protein [Herbinix sp.]
MSTLEIVMIIIGIITVVVSCKLVEKTETNQNKKAVTNITLGEYISEDEINSAKIKINELLVEISEEMIVRTDDYLSKLSNEKIMAVSELAEQLLEKIDRNHDEVVFLYNMLNDKEKELKSAIHEINSSKKILQSINETNASGDSLFDNENSEEAKDSIEDMMNSQKGKHRKSQMQNDDPIMSFERGDTLSLNSLSANSNQQILALYQRGKTIVEISKLLSLGQGEVKLVIDLFLSKK